MGEPGGLSVAWWGVKRPVRAQKPKGFSGMPQVSVHRHRDLPLKSALHLGWDRNKCRWFGWEGPWL